MAKKRIRTRTRTRVPKKSGARIAVKTVMNFYSSGKVFKVRSCTLRFSAKTLEAVSAKLLKRVRRRVQCPSHHSFTVVQLQALDPAGGPDVQVEGGGADRPLRSRALEQQHKMKMRAEVQVVACLPETLETWVCCFRDWPRSVYHTGNHKVACGCEACKSLQEGAATRAARRGRGSNSKNMYSQANGYWTPGNFIKHVTRWDGKPLAGVPKLSSQNHLRLLLPGGLDEEGVEMTPADLKKEFGYTWQYTTVRWK